MTVDPVFRRAARLLLLDADQRILLLRYEENGGFWATPGGSLEPGEYPRDAVVREAREELGTDRIEIGPLVATRTKDHLVGGALRRQVEGYYLATTTADSIRPDNAERPDDIRDWRWWTQQELGTTNDVVYPTGLSHVLKRALTATLHAPIELTG